MKTFLSFLSASFILLTSCTAGPNAKIQGDKNQMAELPRDTEGLEVATLAGGCFWCTEAVFERIVGVKYVISGYAGGDETNPTYKEVSYGNTTHAEAIQIYYDPEKVTYEKLLEVFFRAAHDPTQVDRQGPDRGSQYRSVAFYRSDDEKAKIDAEIQKVESSSLYSDPVATQVVPFEKFYPAEKYHQDYYPANQDNRYIQTVSKPKVVKFEKKYPELLKAEYKD